MFVCKFNFFFQFMSDEIMLLVIQTIQKKLLALKQKYLNLTMFNRNFFRIVQCNTRMVVNRRDENMEVEACIKKN